ncbi:MAG: carbohydrate ABC transporter permease [Armatimonadota bacterium]
MSEAEAVTESRRRRALRECALAALGHLVLIAGGVTMMIPVVWMISTSLKAKGSEFRLPIEWIPSRQAVAELDGSIADDGKRLPVRDAELPTGTLRVAVVDKRRRTALVRVLAGPNEGQVMQVPLLLSVGNKRRAVLKKPRLRVFTADLAGGRRRVGLDHYVKDGAYVWLLDGPNAGELIRVPRTRQVNGETVQVLREVKHVHLVWRNYPEAWSKIQLDTPLFGFSIPYAIRVRPFESTYQIGPIYFRGFDVKDAFFAFYLNSIFVAVVVTLGQVFTSAMAAYAFARLNFPLRDKLFLGYLGTMMIPVVVTMIPNFILLRHFHMIDTYWALILPPLFSAYGTFMLRQFFLTIPTDLEDAARIDGCNRWQIFCNVILPLSKPALATLTVFVFLGSWNNYMWPLIVINSPEKKTLPIGLQSFMGLYQTEWTLLMAASMMVMLPVILVFIFGQRYFVRGIVLSGLKA